MKIIILVLSIITLASAQTFPVTELTPYVVFASPGMALAFNLAAIVLPYHFTPIHFLKHKRFDLPFVSEISLAGLLLCIIHLGLCFAVGTTTYYGERQAQNNHWDSLVTASGQVTAMNYFLLFLPTSKTSLLTWLTNVPFERSTKYHKGVAMLTIVSGLLHLCLNNRQNSSIFYSPANSGSGVYPLYGFLAFIFSCAMLVFALDPIRKVSYELFMLFHHLYIPVMVFIILHYPPLLTGFIPGIVLHGLDAIWKVYSYSTIKFTEEVAVYKGNNESTFIKVKIDDYNKYFMSLGSYYFVHIPSVSFKEWHPFSVSCYDPSSSTCTFNIKALDENSFTKKLFNHVITHPDTPLKIALFGPYGSLSVDIKKYTTVCLVAGGIGVTPMFPIIDDVLLRKSNYMNIQSIRLVWIIRDTDMIQTFANRSSFEPFKTVSLNENETNAPLFLHPLMTKFNFQSTDLEISRSDMTHIYYDIFVTGTNSSKVDSSLRFNKVYVYDNICLHYNIKFGRPQLDEKFNNMTTVYITNDSIKEESKTDIEAQSTKRVKRVSQKPCVLVCGPPTLTQQVTSISIKYGIDLHIETFGY